jgi:hypothetical protein
MKKMGRPTMDPKPVRLTFRLGPRDVAALTAVANELGGNLSEALRHLLREHARHAAKTKKGGSR